MEFQYDLQVKARTGTFGYLPAGDHGWRNGKYFLDGVTLQAPLKVGDRLFLEPTPENELHSTKDLGRVKKIELVEDPKIPGGRKVIAHVNYFLWSSWSADQNFFLVSELMEKHQSILEGKLTGIEPQKLYRISVKPGKN